MSKNDNRILGHAHESDGIEEYDNALPDWWLGLFWFTIVWAVVYLVHYHFVAERSAEKELAAEMAAAEQLYPAQAVTAAEFAMTPEAISAGQVLFAQNCVVCHGQNLEGGIGANLVDTEWIHGSEPENVIQTIREGVAAKGMPPWGALLGPEKVNQLAAFVLSKNAETTGR